MQTVSDLYHNLLPKGADSRLKALLQKIYVLRIPDELDQINLADKSKTIVVVKNASIYAMLQIFNRGFSHCLQEDRADFAKELFTSCLMIIRPQALVSHEIPFFFEKAVRTPGTTRNQDFLFIEGSSSQDKEKIIATIREFLNGYSRLKPIEDLCIQITDELYTNAIYNAPIDRENTPSFVQIDRTSRVDLKPGKKIEIFLAYEDDLLVVGCIDPFGTLKRDFLLKYLSKTYAVSQANPNLESGGAGLGLKMIIDNSASIYIYGEPGKKTIISCGLLLQGMRANLKATKHIHISF